MAAQPKPRGRRLLETKRPERTSRKIALTAARALAWAALVQLALSGSRIALHRFIDRMSYAERQALLKQISKANLDAALGKIQQKEAQQVTRRILPLLDRSILRSISQKQRVDRFLYQKTPFPALLVGSAIAASRLHRSRMLPRALLGKSRRKRFSKRK